MRLTIKGLKEESGLTDFIDDLEGKGYKVKYENVNLNDYGVPQTRKRFTLIATRVNKDSIFPKPSRKKRPTVKDFIGKNKGFPEVNAGYRDKSWFQHTAAALSAKNLQRLTGTPPNCGDSGWWRTDKELGRLKYRGESFKDIYGRMSWDKPAPTITTKFFSLSNGRFGHPEENRAISLREGATLQTFPRRYKFLTQSIEQAGKLIGNAVPPEYAKKIGKAIINSK